MSDTSQKRFYQQNCEMLFWQFWCLYHHPFKALEMGRFWKIRGSTKLERKNGVLWQKVWSKHAFTGANQLPIQDFSITSMFLLWSLSGHLTLQSMLHLFRCIGIFSRFTPHNKSCSFICIYLAFGFD